MRPALRPPVQASVSLAVCCVGVCVVIQHELHNVCLVGLHCIQPACQSSTERDAEQHLFLLPHPTHVHDPSVPAFLRSRGVYILQMHATLSSSMQPQVVLSIQPAACDHDYAAHARHSFSHDVKWLQYRAYRGVMPSDEVCSVSCPRSNASCVLTCMQACTFVVQGNIST